MKSKRIGTRVWESDNPFDARLVLSHEYLTASLPSSGSASAHRKLPVPRKGELFLKGPVPQSWLLRASELPGKAYAVGIQLWLFGLMRRSATMFVSTHLLAGTKISRKSIYLGLRALEKAKLIKLRRRRGSYPKATILDARRQSQ
jgi:hypothetical protein